ncbi:MAG: type IV-A pilus assembly ATPase PilB [Candidatus Rokubacteria bacterium]|nr:type IV-A pilus assembly ATPase PilB [Candidatus Rokubacteria bacterium]
MNPRLGDLLVKEGLLSSDQLLRAVGEQRRSNEPLSLILKRLGFLAEEQLLDFLSRKYGIPTINLSRIEVDPEVLKLVRKEIAQKYQVFPVRKVGKTLTLALSDPTVVLAIVDVQFATGLHVIPVLASEDTIRQAIEQNYDAADDIKKLMNQETAPDTGLELVERRETVDISEAKEGADEAPIIRFVNLIIADAISKRASDIHLEPYENVFRARYRIDGVLHDMMSPPKQMEAAILSRVKIMANLDIAERRLPQDGRISLKYQNREIDLRVSSLPTIFGEKIVLRILDKGGTILDLTQLGFEEEDLDRFKQAITTPFGMILVTGPTGSAKSTTLYAAVSTINNPEINIITAEDPVEYNIPGVNQVHVREDIGYGFGTALRSFLRQDPDVILVGEMRDLETAQIAIRAALTGHLVFSTLHTNDAPSTITRLLDMGLPPFLVSSSLLLVVAQRLVRRICLECREPVDVPLSALVDIGFKPEEADGVKAYVGKGCAACAQTGYRGRIAIHEVMWLSRELRDAIVRQQPANEIRKLAIKIGMRTLRQSGLRKVARGLTTIDEVLRVTFADETEETEA